MSELYIHFMVRLFHRTTAQRFQTARGFPKKIASGERPTPGGSRSFCPSGRPSVLRERGASVALPFLRRHAAVQFRRGGATCNNGC
jgi:hypothetical protein